MGLTSRIASQTLKSGGETSVVTFTPTLEKIELLLTATKVGTADSQVRMVARDNFSRVIATIVVDNTGAKKEVLSQLDGAISLSVECLLGSAIVKVEEETGAEGAGSIETADLADGAVTTLKYADASITAAKMVAAAIPIGMAGVATLADPGNAGTITPPATGGFHCALTSAGVETRVMGVPGFVGQTGVISMAVDAGDITITVAAGWNDDGVASDVATFNDAGDFMVVQACGPAATDWRMVTKRGVTLA